MWIRRGKGDPMGIGILAEAQKEMRVRWGKGTSAVSKSKGEPKQLSNRKRSKPALKASAKVTRKAA